MKQCQQNRIIQAAEAVRDPVRDEKNPLSRRKPKRVIPAVGNLKCWIFPKSKVSICLSRMIFCLRNSATAVSCRQKIFTRKRGSGVSPQLLERYAMCSARWIQCEEMTNRMGFLSKHPTTQKPIPSPFINIGINYMNQAVRLWNEIFQIVKENCSTEYGEVTPQDDLMERLLRARKG